MEVAILNLRSARDGWRRQGVPPIISGSIGRTIESSPRRAAPLFDTEGEEHPPRYRVCRAGFVLVAIGLGLLCFSDAVLLTALFTGDRRLGHLLEHRYWEWVVGGPITWTTLLGAYLLWAGWTDVSWRRRSGMLLLFNGFDMVNWTLRHSADLGLPVRGDFGHSWLLHNLAEGIGWVEFWLFADLAADLAAHLGSKQAADRNQRASNLARLGAIVWVMQFLFTTDWHPPLWPLHRRPPFLPIDAFILLSSLLLTVATTLNVMGLAALACRHCTQALAETAPEKDRGLDLLTSRSETDDFWKGSK